MAPGRRIIQFPHPGGEHVPKNDEMGWNTRRHQRKFLLSSGRIVDNAGVAQYEGPLTFWGEWEPPSTIKQRWTRESRLPTVLHEPYWVDRPAIPHQQNTDPWVFGNVFLYSNCKQLTPARRSSALQDLAPGSLILFASSIGNDFVLDTVFVVERALTSYRPVDGIEGQSAAFRSCTIDSLAADPKVSNSHLTLFMGATPEQPREMMFSFTPALGADDHPPPVPSPHHSYPGGHQRGESSEPSWGRRRGDAERSDECVARRGHSSARTGSRVGDQPRDSTAAVDVTPSDFSFDEEGPTHDNHDSPSCCVDSVRDSTAGVAVDRTGSPENRQHRLPASRQTRVSPWK